MRYSGKVHKSAFSCTDENVVFMYMYKVYYLEQHKKQQPYFRIFHSFFED